jgi:hypothetical protein
MKISQRDAAAMDDLDNALDSESGYTGARIVSSRCCCLSSLASGRGSACWMRFQPAPGK